jgi:hypothetical protein
VYERGLAIWDLSPETLLLTIGKELVVHTVANEMMTNESQEPPIAPSVLDTSLNFAVIDSLMRNQFGVKLKDLAIKKRYDCESNLVCVPDAILKRNCNADVYSVGILFLQLVIGIDLMGAS